ncbi:hypothetical protein EVJ58_g10438 [Rhodofomes roseus]|uniref:Uncharacterized protein n=1 Tax=Rhodofomes roseus TaxID=34475 RepID=A0A4Y9XMY9_9APHY|nr:hypothetical protein EVJ58_g10438 [Rhodofomes roseus]
MSHSIVRFPPPPPTSNNLTPKQRTQLMRSSKKLSQVLGSTPHVLDWATSLAPSHLDAQSRASHDQPHPPSAPLGHRRSQSSPHANGAARERSSIRPSSRPSTANSAHSQTSTASHASSSSSRGEQAWRTPYDPLHRPPLLKLQPPGPRHRSSHSERKSTYSDCDTEASVPDSPTAPVLRDPLRGSKSPREDAAAHAQTRGWHPARARLPLRCQTRGRLGVRGG